MSTTNTTNLNLNLTFGVSTTGNGNGEDWSWRPVIFFGDELLWTGHYPVKTYEQAMEIARERSLAFDQQLLAAKVRVYGSAKARPMYHY